MSTVGKKPIIFVAQVFNADRAEVEAKLTENGFTKDLRFPNGGNSLVIYPTMKLFTWDYGFKWSNTTKGEIVSGELFTKIKEEYEQ